MTATRKRIFTVFLLICICISLCSLAPISANAEGEISKVLTTLSGTPVVMDGVYSITAATSTEGCYLTSYGWYNSDGSAADGTFSSGSYRVEITVTPADGYYFSSNLSVYLNNSTADFVWNGSSITLYRSYDAQLWAPSITKNPTDEKVNEGEMASFVAIATYTTEYEWTATSPDGKTSYNCNDLPDYFPGVTIGGDGEGKMNIRNVPAALDGWSVKCKFTGPGGSVTSSAAKIKVNVTSTPSPSPTATAKPSASPSPTVSPTATAAATDSVEPSQAPVDTDSSWHSNTDEHWHEDSSGDKVDMAEHSMTWSVVMEATKKANGVEKGICQECGYTTERSYESDQEDSGWSFVSIVVVVLVILILLVIIGLVISGVKQSKQRKRKKAAARAKARESYHDNNRYQGRH